MRARHRTKRVPRPRIWLVTPTNPPGPLLLPIHLSPCCRWSRFLILKPCQGIPPAHKADRSFLGWSQCTRSRSAIVRPSDNRFPAGTRAWNCPSPSQPGIAGASLVLTLVVTLTYFVLYTSLLLPFPRILTILATTPGPAGRLELPLWPCRSRLERPGANGRSLALP